MHTVALFFLLACGGGDEAAAPEAPAEDVAPTEEAAPEAAPAAEAFAAPDSMEAGMQMCLGAVDCVAVALDCCGCDAYVAVNKTRVDEVKEKHGQKSCDDVSCDKTECTEPEVTCEGGCKLVEGG